MRQVEIGRETDIEPTSDWQRVFADAIRDPDQLCDLLSLPDRCREPARRAHRLFPLIVPRGYVEKMEAGNPDDPLLKQVLPLGLEESSPPGFVLDPVGDLPAKKQPGLLQKYQGRALLILTGACAVNCRFCFRRHFPYSERPRGIEEWEPVLTEIQADAGLEEIILSGGDPLAITDAWLARFAERLDQIPQLKRLRIHTRLPIVLPERVNDSLLRWLTMGRLQPIVVVHANHPRELHGETARALTRLNNSGVLVLNQAVLLAGINDDADVLTELCRRLVELRVMPYYLHQLDRVQGAAHFEVPEEKGRSLVAELRRRLPGYAVPRYVREIPGVGNKTVLA
ncbi:MAG: EF-P beta-lysylation protein EpmB [Planctomycetota bacterium]